MYVELGRVVDVGGRFVPVAVGGEGREDDAECGIGADAQDGVNPVEGLGEDSDGVRVARSGKGWESDRAACWPRGVIQAAAGHP
ncbi:MAG: hypothetical protein WCC65_05110, partial [Pseudonocardiaceae bacterium]